ncbi:tRNA (N6-isopentenyl adenosine(37)-C2)-methylthiotransferase MiaB [Ruminococcaceae bacterium OttesenSCG-928-L11]|nr:tRNA (N6-isopentenyl adenosine(37)-C2)-methylthiotransferase MiaB [Ruminococcaceae bacterium OttesenSCG-928-L11]
MIQNKDWTEMQGYIDWIRRYNEEKLLKSGSRPTAFTHHYGCQQNVSDGERIDGMLREMGYAFCERPDEADIVIYNTCAVRENAEDRIFGNVGALKHAKHRNPDMVIGLCGCMVQQEHIAEKFRGSFPFVDVLFGPSALPEFPEILYRKLSTGSRVFEILDATGEISEDLPVRRDGDIKAWIPIMYGCNNFCTYCVVPYVRGRERSRDYTRVLEEAQELVAAGYRELTLLGQNVNSYRSGDVDFVGLLRMVNDIPGEFRIRFMTSHPKDCSRELVDCIAECDKICNHIHLPVQSGSDRILHQMNRGYTTGQYKDIIGYARQRIPGVTFTSDIIVGFPGETRDDLEQTIALIREMDYQSLFTFIYSRRVGTKAADMADPIPEQEKSAWFRELLEVQNAISKKRYEAAVGTTVRVLTEGPGKSGDGYMMGRTASNIIVEFPGTAELRGQFVDIAVTDAPGWALAGEIQA